MLNASQVRSADIAASPSAGRGTFITPCNEHVAGVMSEAYVHHRVGNHTMRQALDRWWQAPPDAPAAEHTWLPCQLTAESGKDNPHHQCNPSCLKLKMKRRLNQECPCSPGK